MADQGDSTHEGNRAHGISLMLLSLGAFAVTTLFLAAAAAAGYLQLSHYTDAALNKVHGTQAEQLAARLGGVGQGWSQLAEQLASSLPLREAVANNDTATAEALLAQARTLLPSVLRLEIIGRDRLTPVSGANPPLSFACLDLARSAEQGEFPPLEMHLYDDAPAHIDLVRPILPPSGEVTTPLASLILTLEAQTLTTWLEQMLPKGSYVEVRQALIGTRFETLAKAGDASFERLLGSSAKVPGTRWQLELWRSDLSTREELPVNQYATVFAIALVPILLVYILFARILRRVLNKDMMLLVRQAIKSGYGEKHDFGGFRLREFASTSRHLLDHLNDFPTSNLLANQRLDTERHAHAKEEHEKRDQGQQPSAPKKRLPGL